MDPLAGLSVETFLKDYWQKKPLLIRKGLSGVDRLVEPNELAGLALEETVESRIIIEHSPTDWELKHGPFQDTAFQDLPQTHWTLLIQALDHHVPEVADLLDYFNFLPSWRVDDIMASYAAPGGSVGPHYDYYDVFLVQAQGQRHWQIGQQCDDNTPLLPNPDVRILSQFECQQEYTLNPGDILYLPPGVAHHGVAVGNCMTLSVGFRADTEQELLSEYCHFLEQQIDSSRRYQDPELQTQTNPGWISDKAVDRISAILQRQVNDKSSVKHWLGEFLSQTKYLDEPAPPQTLFTEQEIKILLAQPGHFRRDEASRFLYTGDAHRPSQFFVNGTRVPFGDTARPLILHLCEQRQYPSSQLTQLTQTPEEHQLLAHLLNIGALYLPDAD